MIACGSRTRLGSLRYGLRAFHSLTRLMDHRTHDHVTSAGAARKKRFAAALARPALLVATLLFLEGVLRVATLVSPRLNELLVPDAWQGPMTPDSVFGFRGNPGWHDHDARGFRNPVALDSVDWVLLGDSQTYGTGVSRESAWPQAMASATGRSTYSMAFGGWGPGQGLLALPQALALHPRAVVYAFYFGNDLADVFTLASRETRLRLIPDSLLSASAALEKVEPLGAKLSFLFALGDTTDQSPSTVDRLREVLSAHSRLYDLAHALKKLARPDAPMPALLAADMGHALARITPAQRRFVTIFRDTAWRTLLTPAYRDQALNPDDPRVRAGLAGTKTALQAMDEECRKQGVRFLVVLIPTKESVFAPRMTGRLHDDRVVTVVEHERRIREDLGDWLRRQGIETLDVLPDLQHAAAQPYFENADGHPNEVGHRTIARAVAQRLSMSASLGSSVKTSAPVRAQ